MVRDYSDRCVGTGPSRRWFLQSAAALLVGGRSGWSAGRHMGTAPIRRLSDHLLIYAGPINVGIVRHGSEALLIDCGDGSVTGALPLIGVKKVRQVLFTHYHRDQACGVHELASGGTSVAVPAAEAKYFANPTAYWQDKYLWRRYRSFRPHHLLLTRPVHVDQELSAGGQLSFGPATIHVIETPGHTEGSLSFLVEVDGHRVVFCGDCIYDHGQVWDLYSLQKGFSRGTRSIGGYHGFMGDRWRLVESLKRIKRLNPDALVPSHGNVMERPGGAIEALASRFEACYENYVAISALRHYFPELFTDYAGRPGQMTIRPGFAPPDCLRHFGTTWMLVSESGAAFVMDVGSPRIVEQIKRMLQAGEIKAIEGLWVTHYHFDHTDGIPEFQRAFDCPCFADRRLAAVLTDPRAWRLPCLAPEPIRVHRPMEDGQSWQWHEFKMTSYYYPGQTLYHDALLVERGELRMLFVGDSHTMAGIDDYCPYNRNWLGRHVGFQYCLSLIEKLKPTHMFNCHVKEAFTFRPQEIQFMRRNLDQRHKLFGQLVPWEDANYGLDPYWVCCYPYKQQVKAGGEAAVEVVVRNHAGLAQPTRCRAHLPDSFRRRGPEWAQTAVPPKAERRLAVRFQALPNARPGRYVIPFDIVHGRWRLPEFTEAIVDVSKPG